MHEASGFGTLSTSVVRIVFVTIMNAIAIITVGLASITLVAVMW